VAQNKPDYLRLLPTFCISTTKHVSLIMYVPQILAHGDAKTQLFVVNDELAHHPVEK